MLLSRKEELAIQRRLFFSPDGKVALSVHCKQVDLQDFVKTVNSAPLTSATLNVFVERCVRIVNELRQYEICAGLDVEDYKHVWSAMTTAKVDDNPYQESRYSETLRSLKCKRLVQVRRWRCVNCESLRKLAQSKAELFSQATPDPHTANRALSDEQKNCKLEEQQKKIQTYARRLERMEEKFK